MTTIDDVMIKKYLQARDANSFYSRVVICVKSVIKTAAYADKEEYTVYTLGGSSTRLLHNVNSGKLMIDIGRVNMLNVEKATDNFIDLIAEGDTLVFDDAGTAVYANVYKYQPKYRRFLLTVLGTNHNLSTLLKKYGAPIAIKTADQMRYKQAR